MNELACSREPQNPAYAKSGGIQENVCDIDASRLLTTSSRAESWTRASSAAERLTVMSRLSAGSSRTRLRMRLLPTICSLMASMSVRAALENHITL